MKGGRFHIKALSVITAVKNTEGEDFRRLTMDARACVEWRGGPDFLCLVAMASPEAMGRNGSVFCAHFCQRSMGRDGISVPPPPVRALESPNMAGGKTSHSLKWSRSHQHSHTFCN